MLYRDLYAMAKEMLPRAYAPFSRFQVGAALLTKEGDVFTGCNVENSSFGATICAERTAFVKAVSEGVREFEAIAIVSSEGTAWPCGICRQVLAEFMTENAQILLADKDGIESYTIKDLLPESFKL